MKSDWKALLAAFIAASLVNLAGVVLFFNPIAANNVPAGPIVPPTAGFFAYVALSVGLFDWTARQMQNTRKAAFVVAASQFILVNVDFVLTGKRGLMTGAASTVLMVVTWTCVALAYSYFAQLGDRGKTE